MELSFTISDDVPSLSRIYEYLQFNIDKTVEAFIK